MTLQLQFDANQDYQLEAVAGVVDLFVGWNRRPDAFTLGGEVIPNLPPMRALTKAGSLKICAKCKSGTSWRWKSCNLP